MTTAVLRPNATFTAGAGTTYTGGTTWHGVTSDDSDASWAQLPAGVYATVALTTVTLPAGALTKTATVRMRVRSATLTTNLRAYLKLTSAGSVLARADKLSQNTTIATVTGPATAVNLPQSTINNFYLEMLVSPSNAARYLELYVDLVYALVPTCAVTAPTGTAAVSQPPVEWSHTPGSDGTAQGRYHVKVFTAAQYGAGGFDPATSTAAYNSGVLSGSAISLTPPALPNGTYRAYVRTAQIINGANQWSAWAFSGFTVAVTGPAVSSVVPTAADATASISVVVNRNTGGAAWEYVTVERSADGGDTWEFVRGASFAAASGNTFTVIDYEAPHTADVVYRAQATLTSAGEYVTGAWVESGSAQWTSSLSWLKSLEDPALSRGIYFREVPSLSRSRRSGTHQVLGRRLPVVISDVLGGGTMSASLQTLTDTEATDLLALIDSAQPLLLQPKSSSHLDQMWVVVTEAEISHSTSKLQGQAKTWQLSMVEADRPADATAA